MSPGLGHNADNETANGEDDENRDRSFINNQMYIESVRSSGYKNAAMALGELIDNSIQAGARTVTILVGERQQEINERRTWGIENIAVLDTGGGMTPGLLGKALVFGESHHRLDSGGMGKFGVGLPQASISQARRVDVWTWQERIFTYSADREDAYGHLHEENGIPMGSNPAVPFHAFMDVSDDEWVNRGAIQKAVRRPMPGHLKKHLETYANPDSGTIVMWSDLDRLQWKKAKTLFSNSERLVGRMYRHWLTADRDRLRRRGVTIRMVAYDLDHGDVREEWTYRPNDPMYLLSDHSGKETDTGRLVQFEPHGEPVERTYEITENGTTRSETVTMRFSIASNDTGLREPLGGKDAGKLDYGLHAKHNMGVSILRADRELELDDRFIPGKDPRHRWWGAEVAFGPGLDAIMGVTNNKQHAEHLSGVANKTWSDFAEDENESDQAVKERLKDEDPAEYIRLDVATTLQRVIRDMAKIIDTKTTGSRSGRTKKPEDSAEHRGTGATRKRVIETGKSGESDQQAALPETERIEQIQAYAAEVEMSEEDVRPMIADIMENGLKYTIAHAPIHSPAFFTVRGAGGAVVITINTRHKAYEDLFENIQLPDEGSEAPEKDIETLKKDLQKANNALLLMLMAWARLEDESIGPARRKLEDFREDWGRITRDFLDF